MGSEWPQQQRCRRFQWGNLLARCLGGRQPRFIAKTIMLLLLLFLVLKSVPTPQTPSQCQEIQEKVASTCILEQNKKRGWQGKSKKEKKEAPCAVAGGLTIHSLEDVGAGTGTVHTRRLKAKSCNYSSYLPPRERDWLRSSRESHSCWARRSYGFRPPPSPQSSS